MLKYTSKIKNSSHGTSNIVTARQNFKQFFTPQKYSQMIIDAVDVPYPKKIIDLTMGDGSLLIEAINKWNQSSFYGNDIDINCCSKVDTLCPQINCFNKDVFQDSTITSLIQKVGKVDLCIGNPPFDLIKQNTDTQEILKLFNLHQIYRSKFIAAEIIFILQCMRITSKNGTIALILPDGFFTSMYLKPFRNFLIDHFHVNLVQELPNSIFQYTEAKTHILIFQNIEPRFDYIKLIDSLYSEPIMISRNEAIHRMDYNYYKNSLKNVSYDYTIESLGLEVFRGIARNNLKQIDTTHILHTTTFKHKQVISNKLRNKKKLIAFEKKLAQSGDIVLARVGSSVIGKIALIQSGYYIATDCVFILRIKDEEVRMQCFNALISEYGQQWIKAHSKGVAAKHITLSDIKTFPLNLMQRVANEF